MHGAYSHRVSHFSRVRFESIRSPNLGLRDIPERPPSAQLSSCRYMRRLGLVFTIPLPFTLSGAISSRVLRAHRVSPEKRARLLVDSDLLQPLEVPTLPVRPAQPPLARPQAPRRDAHARSARRSMGLLWGSRRERDRPWGAVRGRPRRAAVRLRRRHDDRGVQEGVQ